MNGIQSNSMQNEGFFLYEEGESNNSLFVCVMGRSEDSESSEAGCQHPPAWEAENSSQVAEPLDHRLGNTFADLIRTLRLVSFEMGSSGISGCGRASNSGPEFGGFEAIRPGHQCAYAHSWSVICVSLIDSELCCVVLKFPSL